MNKNTFPFTAGNLAEKPLIYTNSRTINVDDAEKMLETYSSTSVFSDDQWLIDKANTDQNLTNKLRTISFLNIINDDNRTDLKLAALMRLMKRQTPRSIAHMVLSVREFSNSISNNGKSFSDVNEKDILDYNNHLFHSGQTTTLKNRLGKWYIVKDFFKTMGYQKQFAIMEKYVLDPFPDKRRVDEKLIPEEVAKKLDIEYLKDDVPLPFRVVYWTLRLLPNRIEEVLSMKMNCVKRMSDEFYMVSIPTFKQTGPYALGSIKLIEIKYTGIGKFYIDLLNEFIQQRKQMDHSADDDFLLYADRYILKKDATGNYHYSKSRNQFMPLTIDRINYFFKHLCLSRNITADDGTVYVVTTHQFRHNATTDRINSGIFRSIDIQGLTYHHSTTMIEQTYTHQDTQKMKADLPVVFKGRIINTDNDRKINQILAKPYAKNIYKLGVCSDVRNCNKDKSHCLRCKYMIPSVDDIDYYEHELQDWKNKQDVALRVGNTIYAELCEDWINAYQVVINKVLQALTNENVIVNGGTFNEDTK